MLNNPQGSYAAIHPAADEGLELRFVVNPEGEPLAIFDVQIAEPSRSLGQEPMTEHQPLGVFLALALAGNPTEGSSDHRGTTKLTNRTKSGTDHASAILAGSNVSRSLIRLICSVDAHDALIKWVKVGRGGGHGTSLTNGARDLAKAT